MGLLFSEIQESEDEDSMDHKVAELKGWVKNYHISSEFHTQSLSHSVLFFPGFMLLGVSSSKEPNISV